MPAPGPPVPHQWRTASSKDSATFKITHQHEPLILLSGIIHDRTTELHLFGVLGRSAS
jgi:hypothetical protein